MNLKHYWKLPTQEQDTLRMAVTACLEDDCGDEHVPANPQVLDTHCVVCEESIRMLPFAIKGEIA